MSQVQANFTSPGQTLDCNDSPALDNCQVQGHGARVWGGTIVFESSDDGVSYAEVGNKVAPASSPQSFVFNFPVESRGFRRCRAGEDFTGTAAVKMTSS